MQERALTLGAYESEREREKKQREREKGWERDRNEKGSEKRKEDSKAEYDPWTGKNLISQLFIVLLSSLYS